VYSARCSRAAPMRARHWHRRIASAPCGIDAKQRGPGPEHGGAAEGILGFGGCPARAARAASGQRSRERAE
jgi:hypothetical protein